MIFRVLWGNFQCFLRIRLHFGLRTRAHFTHDKQTFITDHFSCIALVFLLKFCSCKSCQKHTKKSFTIGRTGKKNPEKPTRGCLFCSPGWDKWDLDEFRPNLVAVAKYRIRPIFRRLILMSSKAGRKYGHVIEPLHKSVTLIKSLHAPGRLQDRQPQLPPHRVGRPKCRGDRRSCHFFTIHIVCPVQGDSAGFNCVCRNRERSNCICKNCACSTGTCCNGLCSSHWVMWKRLGIL